MRKDVSWDEGGSAEVLSSANDWLVVLSDVSSAPGRPWHGSLADGAFIGLKVKTCKRQPSGHFRIDGPTFNLTKEARAALAALLAPSQAEAAQANDAAPTSGPREESAPLPPPTRPTVQGLPRRSASSMAAS